MSKKAEILIALDEVLELTNGTLKGDESLANLSGWDSLAVIGFMAMADEKFSKEIAAKEILNAKTVDDLVSLLAV